MSNGKQESLWNRLHWSGVKRIRPDFDEFDPTVDFADHEPEGVLFADEAAPDPLDLLIAREEGGIACGDDIVGDSDESWQATGFSDWDWTNWLPEELNAFSNTPDVLDLSAEVYDEAPDPALRSEIRRPRSYHEAEESESRWRQRCGEGNNRRRKCAFARRRHATVRGAEVVVIYRGSGKSARAEVFVFPHRQR